MGDQLHGTAPQDNSQPQSQQRAKRAKHAGLQQNQAVDLAPRHAQGTQGTENRSSLHHAKGYGVVDQKHADDEGQQAKRGQVETKGSSHFADSTSARGGRFNPGIWRQNRSNRIQCGRSRGGRGN